MKTLAILTGAAALLVTGHASTLLVTNDASAATMTSGRPSAVLNKKQCRTVWKSAVPEGHYLDRANAGRYIIKFQACRWS